MRPDKTGKSGAGAPRVAEAALTAELLERLAAEIGARWQAEVRNRIYADRTDLSDGDLKRDVAGLIDGIVQTFRGGSASDLPAAWAEAARRHAGVRLSQNVKIASLLQEYQLLRLEILAALDSARTVRSAAAAFRLAQDLTAAIDTMAVVAAEAYAEAGGREAGRRAVELDAALNAISGGLIIGESGGAVRRMNRAAEEILGFRMQAWTAMSLEERTRAVRMEWPDGRAVPPGESPEARSLRGEDARGEHLVIHPPDGRTVHILSSSGPIRIGDGEIQGSVTTFTDATQLFELLRLRDDLASTVAHDLRQPLTAMMTQSEVISLLLQDGQVEPARRSAQLIVAGVRRMNAMIQDLVDGVRLEAGTLSLNRRPVNLGAELGVVLHRSLPAGEAERLRLRVEGEVPPAWADPARLERLVLNLVTNGLKYSDPGTPVEIVIRRRDGEAEIEVRDRGVGISPEDLPHVFERFYRSRSPARREGIGLGLYISRILAEAHGGRIRVESEPGRGSAFFVTLPLASNGRPDDGPRPRRR